LNQTLVHEIFERMLAVSPNQRGAALDRECGGDPELRRAVGLLLDALNRAGDFLASPTAATTRRATAGERGSCAVGSIIGPYKILEQIGEGGFGTVYMAEQTSPMRRRVAIKVLKPGMDSRSVVGRFEAERQALALMDHPNIAKVFDAGTTPPEHGSLPFFVMELVRGVPITQYCDEARLAPRDRLEILVPVCRAVQHAHTKGVIHRDLKPSNVLVTLHDGRPVPKVIDFGIAKATGAALTDKTILTEFRALIGTPAYMSPEQAEMSGLDIDTRSDIYSLGVLIYELLTGFAPFDATELARAGLAEMQRIIREQEPPRPSTRISTAGQGLRVVADRRRNTPDRLARFVRGELDWIIMRALEKDRSRRYSTADALAADISRFLCGEPVHAAPPSTLYLVQKFVRRHRGPVVAAAAFLLAVLAGLAGTTWGFVDAWDRKQEADTAAAHARDAMKDAQRARDRESAATSAAIGQARRARAAADLMRWGLAHQAQLPHGSPPLTPTELLQSMIERVDRQAWAAGDDEAYTRAALADLLLSAGQFRDAQEQSDRLRALWEHGDRSDPETAMIAAWTAVETERARLSSGGERYWGPMLREQTLNACARVDPALRDAFEGVMRPALSDESLAVEEYRNRAVAFGRVLRSAHPCDDVLAGMTCTLHACLWGRWQTPYQWPHAGAFLDAIEDLIGAIPGHSGFRERLLLAECDVLHLRLARRDPVPWERVATLADAVDRLGEGTWLRGPLDCHVGKAMVVAAGKNDPERTRLGVNRVARGFARIREAPMPHQQLLESSIGALFDTVLQTGDASLVNHALGPLDESIRDTLIDLSPPDVFDRPARVAELYGKLSVALDAHPIADAGTRRMVAAILAMSARQVIRSSGGGTWRAVDEAAVGMIERGDQLFRGSGDPDWMASASLALRGSIIAAAGPDRDLVRRLAERGVALGERIQGPSSPMAVVCRGSEGLWCMHHGLEDEGIRILRRYVDEAIALGPPDSEAWEHATPFVVYLAKSERWDDLAIELQRLLPWMADPQGRVPSVQLMRVSRVALFQPDPSPVVCDQLITMADRFRAVAPDDPNGPIIKGLALAWLGRADEALAEFDGTSRRLSGTSSPGAILPTLIEAGRAVAFTRLGKPGPAREALEMVERTHFEPTERGFVELRHFRERVRQRVAEALAAARDAGARR